LSRVPSPVMILIFRGTHQVMSAEKRLKRGGVAMRLIPVPRHLTSDCGLAIRIPDAERERARAILSASRLLPVSVHIPREDGGYDSGEL
jgi:Putative Se/S carrier protein-like